MGSRPPPALNSTLENVLCPYRGAFGERSARSWAPGRFKTTPWVPRTSLSIQNILLFLSQIFVELRNCPRYSNEQNRHYLCPHWTYTMAKKKNTLKKRNYKDAGICSLPSACNPCPWGLNRITTYPQCQSLQHTVTSSSPQACVFPLLVHPVAPRNFTFFSSPQLWVYPNPPKCSAKATKTFNLLESTFSKYL